jgi:hypothetical protein
LISFGRSIEEEPWVAPLLYQFDRQLSRADLTQSDEQFLLLSKVFSGSIDALRAEGIAIPEEVVVAFNSSFASHAEDPITAQAAWCWGLILGRRASYVAGLEDLRQLLAWTSHDVVMQEAFLVETARSLHNRKPNLAAAIEESMQRLADHPEDFILGTTHGGFMESLAAWKRLPPYEAFDLRKLEYAPQSYEFLGILRHLRKIDRGDYLLWLNRLQNPVVVQHALLDWEITEDFDEFLALLEGAPTAYADPGDDGWTSLVAPMLLEVALEHASKALSPFSRVPRDEDAYKKVCDELSTRLEQLAQRLVQRSDGSRLAAHWLMRLVRMKTLLNPWLALPPSMAIKAIVQAFGDSENNPVLILNQLPLVSELTDDDKDELRASGKGKTFSGQTPKSDVLMSRLLLKAFRSDTSGFKEEFQLFEELLLLRDSGLFDPNLNELPTWRHQLASCTFLEVNLASTWKRLWEQLEGQRLRSKHSMFTNDRSADEASLFLCATGLSVLENRASLTQPEEPSRLTLWNEVYTAIWFQTLVYSSHVEARSWRYLLVLLLGALPKHLDLASEDGLAQLSEIFRSFASDEELTIHTVAQLSRVRVEGRLLRRAIAQAGFDMESILRQFERNAENVEVYPLSKRWKDVSLACRELLAGNVS